MKVLVFGPSGSGKTYLANALKKMGIPAYDDCEIAGLSNWYNAAGKRIPAPKNAEEAIDGQYAFLWSRKVLKTFLNSFDDVYVFGGSGNTFDVLDLFDKVYFLQIDATLQRQRLLTATDRNPLMDFNADGVVIWGKWLEQTAQKRGIPMVSAALPAEEIWEIISKK